MGTQRGGSGGQAAASALVIIGARQVVGARAIDQVRHGGADAALAELLGCGLDATFLAGEVGQGGGAEHHCNGRKERVFGHG